MPIDPKDIATGKCFITAGEQVRRILGTRGADVFYEVRSRQEGEIAWGPKKTVSIVNFAATVEREVPFDVETAPPVPRAPTQASHPPLPPAAPAPPQDAVVEVKALVARALAATTKDEKLTHLYAAAETLVQAIDALEKSPA